MNDATPPPRLIADIGGTNARFALSARPGAFSAVQVLACQQFATIADAIRSYLDGAGRPAVQHMVIAIATPVQGDAVRMTNHPWSFSVEATRRELGLRTLLVINDFAALAMALPYLADSELQRLDQHRETHHGVKAVVGPGTGLGVAALVPTPQGWQPVPTEGGHASLSPATALETELLKVLWKTHAHVSAERLISGTGIPLLYRALGAVTGTRTHEAEDAAAVLALAQSGACAVASQALGLFSALLGGFAGNVALTFGATGGLYIGGGVVGKLGHHFDVGAFRARFLAKGRFAAYLEAVPNYLILAEHPAFVGAAHQLEQHLA